LHLLILTPGFAVNEADTSCLPFLQLYLDELKKQDCRITIVTEDHPQTENYSWKNIEVITIRKRATLLSKIMARFTLIKTIQAIHKRSPIHVVHSIWCNWASVKANAFCEKNRIRHVVTLAGQEPVQARGLIKTISRTQCVPVCVSEFQLKAAISCGATITEMIHWGLENITPAEQQRDIDLLFCGSLNQVKNYSTFLLIIKKLEAANLIKYSVMCGGGQVEAVILIAQKSGLKSLSLTGEIKRNEVLDLMKRAKIFVHTSNYEAFGLVLAEALACGCHVASTPTGIAATDKNIHQCASVDDFVNVISKLLRTGNPSPRNDYKISETVKRYWQLYGSTS
jgi:1,2-diacylglycerol 3-alpha-glucosyltransferase